MRKLLISAGILIAAFLLLEYVLITSLGTIDPSIVVAIISAASALIVATLTISVGRYLEKEKELDALHREKKAPIYDEFLTGLFSIFYNQSGNSQHDKKGKNQSIDVVKFLQDWQQKIVLWGGAEVVNAYINWKNELKSHDPNVKTIDSTEVLIRAIRNELGHNDSRMLNGVFARFILRNAELYFELSKKFPNLSLTELAQHEQTIVAKHHSESHL